LQLRHAGDGRPHAVTVAGSCRIPLEIRVPNEKVPIYEVTLEDLGRPNEQPILPFNAFGTMAWARSEFDNNSASSQVFWLLKESELTPSGANLLDGRYAVFGYVVDVRAIRGRARRPCSLRAGGAPCDLRPCR
jgi:cyclophilin family peptidyl-prolyl cis-trans isomerase